MRTSVMDDASFESAGNAIIIILIDITIVTLIIIIIAVSRLDFVDTRLARWSDITGGPSTLGRCCRASSLFPAV